MKFIMLINNKLINIVILLFIFVLSDAWAQQNTNKNYLPEISWSKLTYSTSFLFIHLSSDVILKSVSSKDVLPHLINSNNGKGLLPKKESLFVMTLLSDNLGRKSTINIWFEDDLTTLQRTQLDTGRRFRHKTFRFLNNGVYSFQKTPKDQEKKLPYKKWSDESENFYPDDYGVDNQLITDDAVLFYALATSELNKPGDNISLHTFSKEYLNHLTLTVENIVDLDVEYVKESSSGNRVIEDNIEVMKIRVDAEPVGKNVKKGVFEFLGLKGNLYLFMEKDQRVVLQISGDVDYIGTVDIGLERMKTNN